MKQGLSSREKVLLFSAGLVVILYLSIQFFILPLATRYIGGIEQRNHLAAEKTRVDRDIADRATIENTNREAGERFEAIKQEYPLLVPNEEVDTILTNLCLLNGLRPTSLDMSLPASSRSGSNSDTEALFTIVTAKMNMTGPYSSVARLLDAVNDLQYIRITNLGYVLNRQAQQDNMARINIDFELTFVNP